MLLLTKHLFEMQSHSAFCLCLSAMPWSARGLSKWISSTGFTVGFMFILQPVHYRMIKFNFKFFIRLEIFRSLFWSTCAETCSVNNDNLPVSLASPRTSQPTAKVQQLANQETRRLGERLVPGKIRTAVQISVTAQSHLPRNLFCHPVTSLHNLH